MVSYGIVPGLIIGSIGYSLGPGPRMTLGESRERPHIRIPRRWETSAYEYPAIRENGFFLLWRVF